MANHCRTICTITGPDAEIERLKQTCFVTAPPIPGYCRLSAIGIDFTRAEWKARSVDLLVELLLPRGAASALDQVGVAATGRRADADFSVVPELTFDLYATDEFGNFFVKGPIKAGVADLHDDEEAMEKHLAFYARDDVTFSSRVWPRRPVSRNQHMTNRATDRSFSSKA